LLCLLGAGGMGEVYRALDTELGREVAIKVLPSDFADDPERVRRFEIEARAAAAISHPNILAIHDVGRSDGTSYLVSELLEGETLRRRIRTGWLTITTAVDYGIQAAEGLAAAHAKGIVHRDLKAENLFLTTEGRVKILDFGLAKLAPAGDALDELADTVTGVALGTVGYMAPEVLRGQPADPRSDLFSLGAVLYEMVSGRRPFPGSTPAETVAHVLHDDPAPLAREVPAPLQWIVRRCLEKRPEDRFQSAHDLALALEALGDPARARVPIPGAFHRRPGRTALTAVAAAAVITVAVVLGGRLGVAPTGNVRFPAVHSVAVLPLLNLSGDPQAGETSLADGMTDQLISGLATVPELRVIGHRSVMRFKDSDRSIREIAQELGVDAVVEGSVSWGQDRVRINARLVDGERESTLWDTSLERPRSGVLRLQSDLAATIAGDLCGALGIEMHQHIRSTHDVDPEAYAAYLRGQYWWNRDVAGYEKALEYFRRAVELDPAFGPGWAWLSQGYTMLGCGGLRPPEEVRDAAAAALERAKQLAPDDPDVLAAEGHYLYDHGWDWEGSERALRRAIEISPSYALGYHLLGAGLYKILPDHEDEAVELMKQAFALEPLSPNLSADVAMMLRCAGRLEEADAQLTRTEQMFPEWDNRHDRVNLFIAQGRPEDALHFLDASTSRGEDEFSLSDSVLLYARVDRADKARESLDKLKALAEAQYVPSVLLAVAYDAAGEPEQALHWLETAIDGRHPMVLRMHRHPWISLKGDPRLEAQLARIGLPRTGTPPARPES